MWTSSISSAHDRVFVFAGEASHVDRSSVANRRWKIVGFGADHHAQKIRRTKRRVATHVQASSGAGGLSTSAVFLFGGSRINARWRHQA
jgi:hypothetical protein